MDYAVLVVKLQVVVGFMLLYCHNDDKPKHKTCMS